MQQRLPNMARLTQIGVDPENVEKARQLLNELPGDLRGAVFRHVFTGSPIRYLQVVLVKPGEPEHCKDMLGNHVHQDYGEQVSAELADAQTLYIPIEIDDVYVIPVWLRDLLRGHDRETFVFDLDYPCADKELPLTAELPPGGIPSERYFTNLGNLAGSIDFESPRVFWMHFAKRLWSGSTRAGYMPFVNAPAGVHEKVVVTFVITTRKFDSRTR